MSGEQKIKVWVAVVDAVVSTITVLITIFVKDLQLAALILPLLVSYQAIAIALIIALTSSENAGIHADAKVQQSLAWKMEDDHNDAKAGRG